jgi:hypothetical protein
MRTVKLLTSYLGHKKDDIILVDNNIAFGLIDSGRATHDIKIVDEIKVTKEMRVGKKKRGDYKIK